MIIVPDDFPSVFDGTAAHERAKKLGDVTVFTERGADAEQELIRRIGRAEVAINIRAHARFSEAVFTACPALKMVSVWGTGTDNFDLARPAARRHHVQHAGRERLRGGRARDGADAGDGAEDHKLDARDAKGKWPRELLTQLLGKTLGVFGMGTIGSRVAALGKAIGMDVLGWSRLGEDRASAKQGRRPPRRTRSWPGRMSSACTCDSAPKTRGFIGRKELG